MKKYKLKKRGNMKIIKKILLSMFAVLSFTLFTGVANAA
jgi:hypothetical protein